MVLGRALGATVMLFRQVQTILVPAALVGGYILFSGRGIIGDVWEDFAGPFLFSYWIGLGFTIVWDVVRQSVDKEVAGPAAKVIVGLVIVAFLLAQLDGPDAILDDLWLLGVMVAPGIEMMKPALRSRHTHQEADPADGDQQPEAPGTA
jgi:hypothetical protein